MRSWFFEKISKIDKPLAILSRGHRDSFQMNNMRNEKGDITSEPEELQNIIRTYYKSSYSTKLEILDEMDPFLDRYQEPNLIQDQINHLSISITPKEITVVIKSLPIKKKPRSRWL